uniref:EAL domain-containing protein n=1 Tax=Fundidesulfovibrio putealis TaxID=270496 RepID=A0A7C3W8R7_9BACT
MMHTLITPLPASGRASDAALPLRPLFDLGDGTLAAAELSLRRMPQAGRSRLDALSSAMGRARASVAGDIYICVTLDGAPLADPSFPLELASASACAGSAPEGACLFFPDSLCRQMGVRLLESFLTFKRLGFRLGLDVTELAAMPSLLVERLPVDVLRLGPADILGLREDRDACQDILDFTAFCDNLLIVPAARGLANREQSVILRELGVQIGQGPLYARAESLFLHPGRP